MSKASGSIDLKSLKVAGEGASKYITEISSDGIRVHDANTINNSVVINSDGMEIFKGGTTSQYSIAKYGNTVRVGAENDANIEMSDSSIVGRGNNGTEFFNFGNSSSTTAVSKSVWPASNVNISDFPTSSTGTPLSATLPDTPNTANIRVEVTLKTAGDGTNYLGYNTFSKGTSATKTITVTIGTSTYYTFSATYNGDKAFSGIKATSTIPSSTYKSISVAILYQADVIAPSYKIGGNLSATGTYSYTEGYSATASGNYSHAEGYGTTASGNYSHAEGQNNTSSGFYSHAEGGSTEASGYYSHAEGGSTVAGGGYYAHAEGQNTVASGTASHAQNTGTIAAKVSQTAIGKYNVEDTNSATNGQYALIIGNGTGASARSNALGIEWSGRIDSSAGASFKGDVITTGAISGGAISGSSLTVTGNVTAAGQYQNLYKITTVTKTISGGINANSYVQAGNITMTAQSGYNAVGIVGHSSNYFRVQPTTNYIINNTTLYAGFANWSATNVTSDVTVIFYILWLKATAG